METPDSNEEIEVVFVESLTDFIEGVIKFGRIDSSGNKSFLFWYRGHANSKYNLIPKLYRKAFTDQSYKNGFWKKINEDESNYLNDFRIRNYHLIDHFLENDLTWMSIMQHYGTPTRLLDWSENALSAFFFALEDYFSYDHKNEEVLPCIWCLKPRELNNITKNKYELKIDSAYLPDMFSLLMNPQDRKSNKHICPNVMDYFMGDENNQLEERSKECWPLSIIAPYSNDRIRAQSGVFTLFPISINLHVKSVNEIGLESKSESGKFLRLFILLKPEKISLELKAIGLKRSMFYPEMPSISYDIEQELNLHLR